MTLLRTLMRGCGSGSPKVRNNRLPLHVQNIQGPLPLMTYCQLQNFPSLVVVPIRSISYKSQFLSLNNVNIVNVQSKYFSTHTTLKDLEPVGKKKKMAPVLVLLIDEKDSITVVTMEDAEKIAKKRKFNLIEVQDVENKLKTEKKVFKLVSKLSSVNDTDDPSGSGSEGTKKIAKTEDKIFLLKAKISQHDLISKVKQINKMLEKGYSVRIVIGQSGAINTTSPNDAERVYSTMIEHLVEAKIKQKQVKGNEIKFVVSPEPSKVPKETKQKDKEAEISKDELETETEAVPNASESKHSKS